jgi:hypothetical protein
VRTREKWRAKNCSFYYYNKDFHIKHLENFSPDIVCVCQLLRLNFTRKAHKKIVIMVTDSMFSYKAETPGLYLLSTLDQKKSPCSVNTLLLLASYFILIMMLPTMYQ